MVRTGNRAVRRRRRHGRREAEGGLDGLEVEGFLRFFLAGSPDARTTPVMSTCKAESSTVTWTNTQATETSMALPMPRDVRSREAVCLFRDVRFVYSTLCTAM